jgi:hypothetical protein
MRWSERAAALALIVHAAALVAAQPKPPAAPERPLPITPVGLVGRWSDSGDCTRFVIFRSDGTFLGRDGGQGNWRLVRGRLTLTGSGGTVALTIRSLTVRQMVVVNPDGSTGTSRRC